MGNAADSAIAAREQFMRRALVMAGRSLAAGGPPVGACLIRAGKVLAEGHNSVISELDVTAHAEIQVIRAACQKLRALNLSGCDLYVTVQPCPMCLSACFYAGIARIVYGAPIESLRNITQHELCVAAPQLFAQQANVPVVEGDCLAADCMALIDDWARSRAEQLR
jgi:tRNA(Arg) A34 adenosine deaminase TadA